MKSSRVIAVVSILLMVFKSLAQDIDFEWAYSIYKTNGNGSQTVVKMDTDSEGNIYVFGTFSGTVQFDYINASEQRTSNGSVDSYILKLSASRDFLWVKTFGGIGSDGISDGLVFDDQSIYLTGIYQDTVDVDPGNSIYNIATPSQYEDEIFVLKLDTAGNFIWAKDFGSQDNYDNASCITVDNEENVYVGGAFQGTVDFDHGIGVTELISAGSFDAFIQKLDAAGNFIWVKQFGANNDDVIKVLSTDENRNIYAAGQFRETVDFDTGTGTYLLSSSGGYDAFIQKLDKQGEFVFAQAFGSSGQERMNDMFIKDEFIYTTGMFFGTVDFDGSANTDNKVSAGNNDLFIHKIDTSGVYQWVKTIGSTGYDESVALHVDSAHNIYTCGLFSYDTDFDPGSAVELISSDKTREQFVHKLDSSGGFQWVYPIVNNGNDDFALDLMADNNGSVIVGGRNMDGIDLDIGPQFTYVSGGSGFSSNAFVYKLKFCNISTSVDVIQACNSYTWINGVTYTSSTNMPTLYLSNTEGCDSIVSLDLTILESTYSTQSITSCNEYTWIDGNTYTSSNNSATHVLTNSNGCDSIISLNLTINESSYGTDQVVVCEPYTWIDGNTYSSNNNTATYTLNTVEGCDSIVTLDLIVNSVSDLTITSQDTILVANNTSANYQWLRCDNNMLPIWNATDDTLIIMENGVYAVAIAENGCVDTSDCVTVSTLNLPESEHINKFKYYPNPTNGKIHIEMDQPGSVSVYDITGRVIKTPQEIGEKFTVDLTEQKQGIYIFYLRFVNRTESFKVVLK